MTWKVKSDEDGTHTVYDDSDWYVTSCQNKQRAQLIAAAPVMLEALEAIMAVKPPRWPDLPAVLRIHPQCRAIARTAIAAAKGEASDDIG